MLSLYSVGGWDHVHGSQTDSQNNPVRQGGQEKAQMILLVVWITTLLHCFFEYFLAPQCVFSPMRGIFRPGLAPAFFCVFRGEFSNFGSVHAAGKAESILAKK